MTSSIEQVARQARNADIRLQRRLAEMYARAVVDVTDAERALARDIQRRKAAGETIKPTWLNQQSRYLSLQGQYYRALSDFGMDALDQMRAGVPVDLQDQLEHTLTQRRADGRPAIDYNSEHWATVNKRALAVGSALIEHDASPLRQLFERDFPNAGVEQFRRTWTRGLTMGQNPIRIAAASRRAIAGLTLGRAQTIARTEFHRAYRQANVAQWESMDIIEGWVWRSALDGRTCAVCWAMHGTVHKKGDTLDSHPACRCIMVPVTDTRVGDERTERIGTGEDRFSRLPEAAQRRILGPSRYKMYKEGRQLQSFIQQRQSPLWGRMRTLAPLGGSFRNMPRPPTGGMPARTTPPPPRQKAVEEMTADEFAVHIMQKSGAILEGSAGLTVGHRKIIDEAIDSYLKAGIDLRQMITLEKIVNTGLPNLGKHPLSPGHVPADYSPSKYTIRLSELGNSFRNMRSGYGVYDGHDGFKALMQHEIGHAVHHSLSSALQQRWAAIHHGTNGGATSRQVTKQLNSAIQKRAKAKRELERWQRRAADPEEALMPDYIERRIAGWQNEYDAYTRQIDALRVAKKGMKTSGDVYPSKYGSNNPNEDFAETMWRYLNTPEWLAANAPERYAFMKEVFPG